MPSAFNFSSSGATRSQLVLNTSADFGVTLAMRGLHFEGFVDVIAFPARLLVVDMHLKRQGDFALRKDGIEIARRRLEDMFASLFAGREIAAFAKAQHHGEKPEIRLA